MKNGKVDYTFTMTPNIKGRMSRSERKKNTTKRPSRFISGAFVGLTTLTATFFGLTSYANSETNTVTYQQTVQSISTSTPKNVPVMKTQTVESIKDKILKYSLKYDVDPRELENIVRCETGATDVNKASTTIQSNYLKGTPRRELSFGVAQIHVSAHGISKEQAYDVDYSLDFLASHWAKGHQSMWLVCSKKYGYL